MLHHRQVRRIERGAQGWALYEVLTMSGVGFEHGPAWKEDATLDALRLPVGRRRLRRYRCARSSAVTTCRSAPSWDGGPPCSIVSAGRSRESSWDTRSRRALVVLHDHASSYRVRG